MSDNKLEIIREKINEFAVKYLDGNIDNIVSIILFRSRSLSS